MPKEFQQTSWDALVEDECRRLVRAAVLEDLDRGQDWTTLSLVPMDAVGRATIVARQQGAIAGLPAVQVVADEMDRRLNVQLLPVADRSKVASEPSPFGRVQDEGAGDLLKLQARPPHPGPLPEGEGDIANPFPAAIQFNGLRTNSHEGHLVDRGTALAVLEGPARSLLTAERLMLNFLGRLSGIATMAHRFAEAIRGTNARIYDIRKTAPGWRRLEKYAVRQGGGTNHRAGLYDAILIKDNHLAWGNTALGKAHFTPAEAVRQAKEFILENFPADDPRREMIVEVEVDSLTQLEQVLPEQPDIVLLDNMESAELRRAVAIRNSLAPAVQLEASGGVSLSTVRAIAETGVERISAGALTHSAGSLDVALDWAI